MKNCLQVAQEGHNESEQNFPQLLWHVCTKFNIETPDAVSQTMFPNVCCVNTNKIFKLYSLFEYMKCSSSHTHSEDTAKVSVNHPLKVKLQSAYVTYNIVLNFINQPTTLATYLKIRCCRCQHPWIYTVHNAREININRVNIF